MSKFHLVSERDGILWFGKLIGSRPVRISTVELPFNMGYETCVFSGKGSEIVGEYKTEDEATLGHMRIIKQYGLTDVEVKV
jgi:hypothetical protein